jgi:hypothetical protein
MSSDILFWILVVAVVLAGVALLLQLIMLLQIRRNIERTNEGISAIITATTPLTKTKSILLLVAETRDDLRITIQRVRDSIASLRHSAAQIALFARAFVKDAGGLLKRRSRPLE